MISLNTASRAQTKIAENTRARRVQMDLTQKGLSKRSGVPLATVRKFEQQGTISLQSFLKLYMVLGGLDDIVSASEPRDSVFSSIDEVLEAERKPRRQRGTRT